MALARHPLCVDPFGIHEANGEVVLATDVHHVEPVSDGNPVLTSLDKLEPLCHSCHSKKTAAAGGGPGRDERATGEGGSNLYERPTLDRRPSQIRSAAGFDRGVE